jgi:hypothetical protein
MRNYGMNFYHALMHSVLNDWNGAQIAARATCPPVDDLECQEMYNEVVRCITLWRDASAAGKVGRGRIIDRKA